MRTLALLLSLFLSLPALAQDAAAEGAKGFWADPVNDPMLPLYVITTLVFVVLIMVLVVAAYMVRIMHLLANQAAKERAERLGIPYKPQPGWWTRIWQSLNDFKPVEEEKSIELDHNYDGIRELDNHLPPWWKWLFYFTIGWSAVYLVLYHVSDSLPLSGEEYEVAVNNAEVARQQFLASQPKVAIDENTLAYTKDDALIAKGKEIFATNCATCHKALGEGDTGPNLTDDYWIHGGGIKDIYSTVKNGVTEKGMPAWQKVLSPEDIRNVAFFIKSLRGSNPPGALGPKGELYVEPTETPAAPADSTSQVQASL